MKQTFKKVTIQLTEHNLELSRAGWRVGDIIQGSREFVNEEPKASVWFGSKASHGDCVAYLGNNCKLAK